MFIEPHGMKLETHPATNPKVNLYKKLQTQEEDARKKSKVAGLSLDAFIVSATPFDDLQPHLWTGMGPGKVCRCTHFLW